MKAIILMKGALKHIVPLKSIVSIEEHNVVGRYILTTSNNRYSIDKKQYEVIVGNLELI